MSCRVMCAHHSLTQQSNHPNHPTQQIRRQFPSAFEFTEDLLLFLARYHHSGWFGDFLHDSERERYVVFRVGVGPLRGFHWA